MNLAEFLPYVHDQLPSVPQPVALRALADASRSFFTDTGAWQIDLTPISLKAGRSIYGLDVDSQQDVVTVLALQRIEGGYLRPMPNLDQVRSTGTGDPSMYFASGNTVELGPVPSADKTKALKVRVAVTLKRKGTELPDELADEYVKEIAARARMELAMQPMYANPAVVAAANLEYVQGMVRAKRRAFFSYGAYAPQITLTGW
jgi:hypothetical protein